MTEFSQHVLALIQCCRVVMLNCVRLYIMYQIIRGMCREQNARGHFFYMSFRNFYKLLHPYCACGGQSRTTTVFVLDIDNNHSKWVIATAGEQETDALPTAPFSYLKLVALFLLLSAFYCSFSLELQLYVVIWLLRQQDKWTRVLVWTE